MLKETLIDRICLEEINKLIMDGKKIIDNLYDKQGLFDIPYNRIDASNWESRVDFLIKQLPQEIIEEYNKGLEKLECAEIQTFIGDTLDIEEYQYTLEQIETTIGALELIKQQLEFLLTRQNSYEELNLEFLPTKIVQLFKNEHYQEAVFEAFKFIETQVRTKGNYQDNDLGVNLMRKAFHKDNGALRNPSLPEGERQAQIELFSGAIGFIKNPKSHHLMEVHREKAIELLYFANYLLRVLNGDYSQRSL